MSAPAPTAPGSPGLFERIADWRFPVRFRVPERDELIALAVATLAMGLVLGIAIGPGLGSVGKVFPVITPSIAGVPVAPILDDATDVPTALPPLAAPAGSVASTQAPATTASVAASTPVSVPVPAAAPTTVTPTPTPATEPTPAPSPDPPAPEPDAPGDALTVKGTVLATSGTGTSYAVADNSGNLLTIFASSMPEPGYVVSVPVEPLANGTFAESGQRQAINLRERTKVRAIVTWVDAVAGVIVLSNRGASLPLDGTSVLEPQAADSQAADPAAPDPLIGEWVEAKLYIVPADPDAQAATSAAAVESAGDEFEKADTDLDLGLRIESLEPLAESAQPIELNGRVEAVDQAASTMLMTVDSLGLLPATVTISVPARFELAGVEPGKFYSATVRKLEDGTLRLTGFSPNFSRQGADDLLEVFGEQR